MKVASRLSSEERRQAIVKAVRRVFAEKGFHGTTTRELAKAAGVSEALLFKHFPSKEALYSAMHAACHDEQVVAEFRKVLALEPSTSTLVLLTHFLVAKIVLGQPKAGDGEDRIMYQLMCRSLMEDGEFARLFLERLASCWLPKLEECLTAAAAAGDLVAGPVRPALAGWFAHHLAVVLMSHHLTDPPVIDYGLPRERLVEQAVWFALRGMGLRDAAIQRHYNPKAFALFAG